MPSTGLPKASVRERFRYWFDTVMARGTIAVMGLLALASAAFIAIVAIPVVIFGLYPHADGDDALTFREVLWGNLMRTLDAGTMADDEGWPFRIAMLVVTVGGLVLVASLIGIVSGAFDAKVDDLRKGRSRVLESGHTLILGWSPKVLPIVSQLCIANESRRRPVIVVVADRDKVELEDELREHVPRGSNTRIIVRSGDPMHVNDLALGSPHTARSIIILAPEGSEDPDSVVIKTALALTNGPQRSAQKLHIVGELQQASNLEAAAMVGGDEAHWILSRELISRITVQACRQSGLSSVYTELLSFDGNEIYFTSQPSLIGTTYFDAQLAFVDSCVIGVARAGRVLLNPDAALTLEAHDQLVVIAEDDSTIRVSQPGEPSAKGITATAIALGAAERILVLGHNNDLDAVLREIDEYVAEGSEVRVVADLPAPALPALRNTAVQFSRGDTTSRAVLEALEVASFDHTIVLAYKDSLDEQRADAKTLVTLLHLREIGERLGRPLNIVSEMLDDHNREIAEVTEVDDFIVSDQIISLTLAQISEHPLLADVWRALFSSTGCEIYLKPATDYIDAGVSVDFYTVLEAARRRGETAFGYRLARHAHSPAHQYGITLNPVKTQQLSFGADDKIIVLAEN